MGPLRDKRFRRLLAGQSLSSFALNALYLALGIWAKDLTHSNALAGSVFLALGLPTLLAPLAGQIVDRLRRGLVLVATNAILGVAILSLLAVHTRDQLWVIYAVAAACGLATDFVSATRSALVRNLLPDTELSSANAALQTVTQGVRLFSPVAGAGLYVVLGGRGLAVLDAALFAVAAVVLATVRVVESAREPDQEPGFVREMLGGARHIRSVPLLAQLTVVSAVAFSVIGLFETVGFAVIDQGLHRSPSFYGVMDTAQGAGAVLGGLVVARLMRRAAEARTAGTGLVAVGIGALLAIVPTVPTVLAGAAVLGLGTPWFLVGWTTAMQRHTPARLQGRVNATAGMLLNGPQTASIALGAALIAVVDYRIMLLVIFAGMATSGLVLLLRPARGEPDRTDSARSTTWRPTDATGSI